MGYLVLVRTQFGLDPRVYADLAEATARAATDNVYEVTGTVFRAHQRKEWIPERLVLEQAKD